jgi:uncharacterized protein YndB with AHSA1/START domain
MPGKTQVQCQTAIAAPVEEVWAIVQDSTLLPQWMPNVHHTVITTAQSKAVGEIRQCEVSLSGRSGQLVEQCVEFAPLQKISFKVQHDSFGFSRLISDLSYAMLLETSGPYHTQVRLEYYYQEKGLIGRVVNALMIKPQWNPLCLAMLDGLKQFAEQHQEPPISG